jgi:hypothetical protein
LRLNSQVFENCPFCFSDRSGFLRTVPLFRELSLFLRAIPDLLITVPLLRLSGFLITVPH